MPTKKFFAFALVFALALLTGCAVAGAPATSAVASSAPAASASQASDVPISLYFFHDTACGSCDGTEEFIAIFNEELQDEKNAYPYTLNLHNVFETAGQTVYQRVLAENGLTEAAAPPPVLIVNGTALCGLEEIKSKLREMFLSAAESARVSPQESYLVEKAPAEDLFSGMSANAEDSSFVYFYRITCDECNETKPVIEGLPTHVTINGKESRVTVFPLNTRNGSNGERVRAMFTQYNVPEEDQMVPIVFLRETYLAGFEQISAHLPELLAEGAGTEFVFPPA